MRRSDEGRGADPADPADRRPTNDGPANDRAADHDPADDEAAPDHRAARNRAPADGAPADGAPDRTHSYAGSLSGCTAPTDAGCCAHCARAV